MVMVVNLGARALGQALFGMSDPLQFVPFSVVAILICLAALPVTASRMVPPELPPTPRLALVAQYRAAPAAASGALLSGLALGAFWGLQPGSEEGGVGQECARPCRYRRSPVA